MTAADVSAAVAGYWRSCIWNPRRAIVVPNSTGLAGWEADLLIIHPSSWCEEVEIKISLSDFKREFSNPKKCSKHKALERGVPDTRLNTANWQWQATGTYSEHIVRRFWFAIPDALREAVTPLLPPHAGLITVGPEKRGVYRACKVVQAPQLKMARKLTPEERDKAREAVYYRYWTMRQALDVKRGGT